MPKKDTENIKSDLVTEDNNSSVIGSRKDKSNKNKNNKKIDIVSTDKLKKGFTATQKTVAFLGSILSLIVASFTVNNLISGKPTKPTDGQTTSTSIVKVIEKEKPSNSTDKNSEPNQTEENKTNNAGSESEKETKANTDKDNTPQTSGREKEIVREIIREVPASTNTKESSEPSSESSVKREEENKVKKETDTKTEPNLSTNNEQ